MTEKNKQNRLMEGRAVIVTGAGRGIGRAIAMAMAAEGALVVANDIGGQDGAGAGASPVTDVVGEITANGGRAVACVDSVASWEGAQQMVEMAMTNFGRVDAVVNNAGNLQDKIFHQMSPEEFDAVVKVHLYGSFYLSRAAAAIMRKQGSGAFVHMTSTSGLIGNLGQANYAAAKMGIAGLSRSIAIDMARFGIRSNCISPAAFSRMTEGLPAASPEEQAAFEKKLRDKVRPEQVAPLAVFLASDAAADITGQIIGARGNEMYLYSQPRPIRTLHRADGWTPAALAEQMLPAWRTSLTPLERIRDVFAWDPI